MNRPRMLQATLPAVLLLLSLRTTCAQDSQEPVITQVITQKSLAMRYEVEAAQAALDACAANSIQAVVVMVDANGNTKLNLVGDGGNYNLTEEARRKAYTSALQRKSTLDMQKALAANPHMRLTPDSQMLLVGGGVPIYAGSQVVGAIGVEGGTPAVMDQCARAGIDKLKPYLHPE